MEKVDPIMNAIYALAFYQQLEGTTLTALTISKLCGNPTLAVCGWGIDPQTAAELVRFFN